jgi:hypothetical protein
MSRKCYLKTTIKGFQGQMIEINEYIRQLFNMEFDEIDDIHLQFEYLQKYIYEYFIPTFEAMEDEL